MEIKLGQITNGRALGKINLNRYRQYIWSACIDCGKERWVTLIKGIPKSTRCRKCYNNHNRGDNHPRWLGGKNKHSDGYITITLQPDDFFFSMATTNRYVMEHRLVMAKYLGRKLQDWEIVHHKNHNKSDNRIENLQLVSDDRHKQITILENKIIRLKNRVNQLETENIFLKSQLEIVGQGILEGKD